MRDFERIQTVITQMCEHEEIEWKTTELKSIFQMLTFVKGDLLYVQARFSQRNKEGFFVLCTR